MKRALVKYFFTENEGNSQFCLSVIYERQVPFTKFYTHDVFDGFILIFPTN